MKKFFDTVVNANTGRAVEGATVTFLDSNGNPVVTYADDAFAGAATTTTTDENGLYQRYVPNGTYTIRQTFGNVSIDIPGVEIFDDSIQEDTITRALLVPEGETGVILPEIATRAGKYLVFDAGGNPAISDGSGVDAALRTDLAATGGSSLVGFVQIGDGAVSETVEAALRRIVFADQFGAMFDGATDDTVNLQKAFTAIRVAGGGVVNFPPNKTVIISQAILVGSNTTINLNGCTIKAKQSGFTGTNAGLNCFLLRNYNYSASVLTDQNIQINGPGVLDYGFVTISGGGAHAIAMRYVDNITVRDVVGLRGENVTAFLACKDTLVENCEGRNQINCYFDHWDGAGTAKVIGCVGRNDVGTYIAQGIQFTGTGSALEDRSSVDCVVAFNYLEGVRGPSGQSSAIIANANDAGSSTYRMRSVSNTVKNADLGLVWEGAGGQHISIGDTFVGVDQLPIFMQSGSSGAPSNCRIINPHLIDCNHAVGNVALISISGTGHAVRGIKVTNSGASTYLLIAYLAAAASNCIVEVESAANGSGGSRFNNSGTNCTIIDGFAEIAAAQSAWLAYTPTVTAGSGTLASVSASGRYKQIGKTVHFKLTVSITTNGTGATNIQATLPATAQAANSVFGSGRDATTGALLNWFNADTSKAYIVTSAGAYPGADGRSLSISGSYEIA